MRNLIYLPLEHLEERYTPMFNAAFKPHCTHYIYPSMNVPETIESGEFLDINKTMMFKSAQLEMISEMFYRGEIKNGDVFVVADIFFPGIGMIRYMSELANIKVHVFGFNHAGRSDKFDFVRKLSSWSDYAEDSFHRVCDVVFFGSEFHMNRTRVYFNLNPHKLFNTGMIWSPSFVESIHAKGTLPKSDFIVWPHRPSHEKGFDLFLEHAKNNKDKEFVITSCGKRKQGLDLPSNVDYLCNLSKAGYYRILDQAEYYLSTARQETFGYTLREAIHYGCKIAAPRDLSYKEMLPEKCLYNNLNDVQYNHVDEKNLYKFDNNINTIMNLINVNSK